MNSEEAKKIIIEALSEVYDPELNINIVDLGLVYSINIDFDKKEIKVKLGLTTPFCPLAGLILNQAENEIKEKIENYDEIKDFNVNVEFDFEKLWNPNMMSDEAKKRLNHLF